MKQYKFNLRHPILPHQLQIDARTPNSPITPLTNESLETKGSYFSQCSPRTAVRHAPSPSDGLSSASCLTLGSDSTRESDASDDRNSKSLNSSRYLTPPEGQLESESPPHKPRNQSSESLNMIQPVKASTRYRARKQSRARRRRSHKCETHREKIREKERRPYWWLPGSRVATSAPQGFRDGTENYVVDERILRKSIHVNIDDHDSIQTRLQSLPAPPVITRRWSSVGFRQPLPFGDFEHHAKGKTWPNSIKQDNVIKSIRKKLTNRKVSTSGPETPATITLRRASHISGTQRGTNLSTVKNTRSIDHTNQKDENLPVVSDESTYLITSQDVESITRMIRLSMPTTTKKSHTPNISKPTAQFKSDREAYHTIRKPSWIKSGFQPWPGLPADVATTISEVVPSRNSSTVGFSLQSDLRRESTITKVFSKKSVHEIIWEDGSRSCSTSSLITPTSDSAVTSPSAVGEPDTTRLEEDIPQSGIPQSMTSRIFPEDRTCFEDDMFNSQVFRWEWKETTSQDDPPPPFDRDFSLLPPIQGTDARRKSSGLLEVKVDQVISFPALPLRKSTNDWISSPPDIAAIMKTPSISKPRHEVRPMYLHGLDAIGRLSVSQPGAQSAPITPHTEIGEWDFSSSNAKSKSPASNPRRSTVIQHPQDIARVGDFSKPGHAVGFSSGVRRQSSTRLTRIRFEHRHTEEDLEDRKPWKKPRKDSEYPFKRSYSTSPDETASRRESLTVGMHRRASRSCELLAAAVGLDRKNGERWKDRNRIIAESSPQLTIKDRAGIYVSLTGAEEAVEKIGKNEIGHGPGLDNECFSRDFTYLDDANASRNPSVDWIG